MDRKQRAWIAAATESLQDTGSWTGRTHLHKHLFITQALALADVPFEFELHHYGPYSFELDGAIAEMEAFGDLDKQYPQPGYGPSYQLTDLGEEALGDLSPVERKTAERVAAQLQDFDSNDLELIATCLWVEEREGETNPDLIVPRVKEIKPKYSLQSIEWALQKTERLEESLRID